MKYRKSVATLWSCYKQLIATICPANSADRQICYCDNTIKMSKELAITTHRFWLQQLSKM